MSPSAAAAVQVRNGFKCYGRDPNKKVILNYLNMNVPHGSIYGLLGASGCGKTTLLSCIVGQRQLNSGEVRVLGMKPGLPGSGVPGPRIGYMPQEIALVEEMNVTETIYYFGRIYGLDDQLLKERYKLLRDLLELPPSSQLVGKCSGGQRRRISFACAMIHEPEVLILDEPTVGLDPILREKIWHFLIERTRNSKMSVIITTHYIEEAKQANCIGLMRNGILLAEDTPDNIMLKFESTSIEEAFLILSQQQGSSEEASKVMNLAAINYVPQLSTTVNNTTENFAKMERSMVDGVEDSSDGNHNLAQEPNPSPLKRNRSFQEKRRPGLRGRIQFTSKCRMKALLTKNLVQLTRQPSGIIFVFLFPILQLTCFYLAIGNNPAGLKLGIVNNEVENSTNCYNKTYSRANFNGDFCALENISCRFLEQFDDTLARKIYFKTEQEAFEAAKKIEIVGYIHFSKNFSESIQDVMYLGRNIDDASIINSELSVRIDMSDRTIAFFIERKLREAFSHFVENILRDCELPPALGTIPVRFEKPIFGSFSDEYRRYVAPGVVMTMIFFLNCLITAAVFITERCEGVWDRTLVAGISTTEMLFAHMMFQSVIMIIQCIEVVVYVTWIFKTENKGDDFTVVVLLLLTGFSGMLFGLLISVYCGTHTMANFVATGVFYPMIMLCGLLWPIEGMPFLLRKVALAFPFTIPVVAVRNILEKGWSIADSQVYNGFVVMLLWIIVLFTFCIIGLRRKA